MREPAAAGAPGGAQLSGAFGGHWVDLAEELDGPVFEPLKDPNYFARFQVNPDTGTIEWPNRADFAPEFLYAKVRVSA